jgi:hypothetical protein
MILPGNAAVPAAAKDIHTAGETPAFPGSHPGNAAVPAARNDIHTAGETPALRAPISARHLQGGSPCRGGRQSASYPTPTASLPTIRLRGGEQGKGN